MDQHAGTPESETHAANTSPMLAMLQEIVSDGRAVGMHFIDELTPKPNPEVMYPVRARKVITALKRERHRRDMSLAQVADKADVDKSVMSRFENETTDPRLSTLMRYADAVGAELTIHINGENVSDITFPYIETQKVEYDWPDDRSGRKTPSPEGIFLRRPAYRELEQAAPPPDDSSPGR